MGSYREPGAVTLSRAILLNSILTYTCHCWNTGKWHGASFKFKGLSGAVTIYMRYLIGHFIQFWLDKWRLWAPPTLRLRLDTCIKGLLPRPSLRAGLPSTSSHLQIAKAGLSQTCATLRLPSQSSLFSSVHPSFPCPCQRVRPARTRMPPEATVRVIHLAAVDSIAYVKCSNFLFQSTYASL